MNHIEKLEEIKKILINTLGDVDPNGLVDEMESLISRLKPSPTDFEVVSQQADEWIDNVSKGVQNKTSKEDMLNIVSESFSKIKEKSFPISIKDIENLKEDTKEEIAYKNQTKRLYNQYNKEKESALQSLGYRYKLISLA